MWTAWLKRLKSLVLAATPGLRSGAATSGSRSDTRRRRKPAPVKLSFDCLEERIALATVSWVNVGSGDWNTGTNWSSGFAPTSVDDVVINQAGVTVTHSAGTDSILSLTSDNALIISGGSLSIANASTINNTLTLSGATLTGTGAVTVNGLFTWNSGWLRGSGSLTANGGVAINGVMQALESRTLVNAGTATFSSGALIRIREGAVINNLAGALFDFQGDGDLAYDVGALGTFTNSGTVRKSAGLSDSLIDMVFNNSGTVQVQSGQLTLNQGGTSSGSFQGSGGTLLAFTQDHVLTASSDIAAARVTFSNGNSTVAGTYNVTGETRVNSGGFGVTVTGNIVSVGALVVDASADFSQSSTTTVHVPTLTIDFGGSQFWGTTNFIVDGLFTWNGGWLRGSGSLTANGGIAINGVMQALESRTLVNAGTATFSGALIRIREGAVINNLAGALFDFQGDGDLAYDVGALGTFTNSGTVRKSAGLSDSLIDMVFNNSGTVQVQSGQLTLNQGGTSSGVFQGSAGSILRINGPHTFSATSSIVADTVILGDATMAGTYNVTGQTTVDGVVDLTGTVVSVGALVVNRIGNFIPSSATTLTLPTLSILANGTLTGTASFIVTGLFTWSSSTLGVASLTASGGFTHSGNLTLSRGRLNLPGNFTLGPTQTLTFGVGGLGFGQLNVAGNATFNGTLSVAALNDVPYLGDTYKIVTFGTMTPAAPGIGGLNLGNYGTLEAIYNPADITLLLHPGILTPLPPPPPAVVVETPTHFEVSVLLFSQDLASPAAAPVEISLTNLGDKLASAGLADGDHDVRVHEALSSGHSLGEGLGAQKSGGGQGSGLDSTAGQNFESELIDILNRAEEASRPADLENIPGTLISTDMFTGAPRANLQPHRGEHVAPLATLLAGEVGEDELMPATERDEEKEDNPLGAHLINPCEAPEPRRAGPGKTSSWFAPEETPSDELWAALWTFECQERRVETVECRERSVESQDWTVESRQGSVESQDWTVESQERSVESQADTENGANDSALPSSVAVVLLASGLATFTGLLGEKKTAR